MSSNVWIAGVGMIPFKKPGQSRSPPSWAPPNGPSSTTNPVIPLVSLVSPWRPAWYSASNGRAHEVTSATVFSVSTSSASPICPNRPAARPAPKSMKTAIPFAVADSHTEPSRDMPAITRTPAASPSPGPTASSGHQPPVAPVIRTAAVYMRST